ncbi:MAG TPA: hypothetical protein VGO11_10645 [Chthoniobacteraceae bacterium]|nr:hypothetical protein [Chthoniobacteraceae bacterium]
MIDDLRALLSAKPFVPITLHIADGCELHVPTVDHIAVPPAGSPVFVFADSGGFQVVASHLIARVSAGPEAEFPQPS